MADSISSYVRTGPSSEGVTVTVQGGRIVELEGDPGSPTAAGRVSPRAQASIAEPSADARITRPLRRGSDGLQEVGWDEANKAIAAQIGKLRSAHGVRSLALYGGYDLTGDHLGAVRTAAFALSLGTPNLFSPLAMAGASKLFATELVVGAAVPLQADVGRAHYTILIGADQDTAGWGPLQTGSIHTQALDYFRRRRKQNKLVVVDARSNERSSGSDEHVQPRPGTEVYYLLGMAHSILFKNWVDEQYLRDHCINVDRLRSWLEPWDAKRCAAICGVEPVEVSGVGLKFSRAAMGVLAATRNVTQGQHATLACWAWLVVHALTANLLRPGGLFEAEGPLDLQPLVCAFPTSSAPKSRLDGIRNLLLQAPGTALAREILEPGDGQIRGLISVAGCPVTQLPDPDRMRRALGSLELLVALDHSRSPTTDLADWVLPIPHFWERSDLRLLDHSALPIRTAQATPAVLPAPTEVHTVERVLADLAGQLSPTLRAKDSWGRHLRLMGSYLSRAELVPWQDRALGMARLGTTSELEQQPGGLDLGELDRATWRPAHPHGRLDLAPEALEQAMRSLQPPQTSSEHPLALLVEVHDAAIDPRHGEGPMSVQLSPERGVADGATVQVQTPYGQAEGVARVVEGLRPDSVVVAWHEGEGARQLIGAAPLDPFTGTVPLVGLPCSVQAG